MKIKKEFIILAVVVIALGIYLIFNFNRSGKKNYKLPRLQAVKEKEIDAIEFTTPEEQIRLAYDKGEDLWRIIPLDYPVDTNKMDNILDQTKDLTLAELISDKQAYEKYDLDNSNKIHVTAYIGDELVRDFDIGKISDITNHTYIKLADDPNVYSVNLNIRNSFDQSLDDMRDKKVMAINKDSIQEIHITFEDTDVLLRKSVEPAEKKEEGESETVEWKIDGDDREVEIYEVTSMLSSLSNLICDSYIPEDDPVDFTNPYFKIVLNGDKEYTLYAMEVGTDNMHPAVSSESDYQFNLIGWKVNNLMKTLDDFIKD